MVSSWNAVLVLVLFGRFHHPDTDFAQLRCVRVLGQLSSYLISAPAAVVLIFSVLVLVFRSHTRWTLAPLPMYAGTRGSAITGVAAVIDSTIVVNERFHNALRAPGHFHMHYLMGVVLMILGAVCHL